MFCFKTTNDYIRFHSNSYTRICRFFMGGKMYVWKLIKNKMGRAYGIQKT